MENISNLYMLDDEPLFIEITCGDCVYYNGERCTGKFEGHERCAGSTACDEYDCGSDYDTGN